MLWRYSFFVLSVAFFDSLWYNCFVISKEGFMKRNTVNYIITGGLFLLFLIFTLLVAFVDVLPIGPMDSEVGFAALNKAVQSVIA